MSAKTPRDSAATITCTCGRCSMTLADDRATCRLRCGCEDCRQALAYGHLMGGAAPELLPEAVYMRSDILAVTGARVHEDL